MFNSRVKQSQEVSHTPGKGTDASTHIERSYIEPIPCRNAEVYNTLNTLICEYLEVNGLEQALQSFSKECKQKKLPCPNIALGGDRDLKAAFSHYDGEALLKSFDEGNLESFLQLWKQFLTHIQVTSEDMKKLEVYLRVHFAIYPRANNFPEAKQTLAMQQLKTFFEENSATLSSDATILPLFALPFVSDPRPHPIFKDLFQESWATKLRTQLETTVNKYFELLQENITMHCKLASVFASSSSRGSPVLANSAKFRVRKGNSKSTGTATSPTPSDLLRGSGEGSHTDSVPNLDVMEKAVESMTQYHQKRFLQLLNVNRKSRKLLTGVRDNYTKLLKITSILMESLETSLEPPQLEQLLQKCAPIYPEAFKIPSSTNTQASASIKPDLEHFKKLAASPSSSSMNAESGDTSLLFLGIPDVNVGSLDFGKIKDNLASDKISSTEKLCLLQALRRLITKTNSALRGQVISHFMDDDILGLSSYKKSNNTLRNALFSSLLSPTPTYQKESISRLINAIASTWAGRSYLSSTNYLIEILIQSLSTFKTQEESFICHMVIASLQKLSLRKKMRQIMIDHNVIPWVVKYIKSELHRDIIRDELHQLATGPSEEDASKSKGADGNYGDSPFNNYLMEYAWALLMNLCLHPESIKSALTVDFEFLHGIVTMLTARRSSIEYTPYILSTLFSLLRSPVLFQKAKAMNLDQKLGPFVSQYPVEIQSHIKHLLSQLYEKENVDRLTASGETDYDDTDNPDPEEVEPELELQESWMNALHDPGAVTGDDLLIQEYLIPKDFEAAIFSKSLSKVQYSDVVIGEAVAAALNKANTQRQSGESANAKDTGLPLRPMTPTRVKSTKVPSAPRIRAATFPQKKVATASTGTCPASSAIPPGRKEGKEVSTGTSVSVLKKNPLVHPSKGSTENPLLAISLLSQLPALSIIDEINAKKLSSSEETPLANPEFIIGLPPLPLGGKETSEKNTSSSLKEALPVVSIGSNNNCKGSSLISASKSDALINLNETEENFPVSIKDGSLNRSNIISTENTFG